MDFATLFSEKIKQKTLELNSLIKTLLEVATKLSELNTKTQDVKSNQ